MFDEVTAPDETTPTTEPSPFVLRPPTVQDGGAMWRVARDSQTLDLNSSYAYLLWARDFAATSVVAERDGAVVGFVSGYLRPDSPETLMVWQVAVDADQRGHGLAGRMLDHLAEHVPGVTMLETTITDDNGASRALFARFARTRDAQHEETDLFVKAHFPDEGHDPEVLHRIGPF
ncbi:diaminobutyrate acetyltransferase [Janibacter sp. G349]|uniref:diaminobutyrate acetyltransferase n=1 Tax=unclassified Janibacter TaxID=2649294 RepID=UPI0020CEE877|nr:diaminobutyrate acetyltransferase [Janibacter sp. CX7]UTT67561.1 diaminobutyrate acetyltransferase [Janibacter sp. CX7]